MVQPIVISVGAAVIWWTSYLLLRKDKDNEIFNFQKNAIQSLKGIIFLLLVLKRRDLQIKGGLDFNGRF